MGRCYVKEIVWILEVLLVHRSFDSILAIKNLTLFSVTFLLSE